MIVVLHLVVTLLIFTLANQMVRHVLNHWQFPEWFAKTGETTRSLQRQVLVADFYLYLNNFGTRNLWRPFPSACMWFSDVVSMYVVKLLSCQSLALGCETAGAMVHGICSDMLQFGRWAVMHEVLCQRLSHWIKYDKVMESKTVFNDNDSIVVSFWQMAMAGWQGRSRKHASISLCPTSKRP